MSPSYTRTTTRKRPARRSDSAPRRTTPPPPPSPAAHAHEAAVLAPGQIVQYYCPITQRWRTGRVTHIVTRGPRRGCAEVEPNFGRRGRAVLPPDDLTILIQEDPTP